MIETIEFQGHKYPKHQGDGFAARFAFPFAKEICKGQGLDIGYGKPEWCFPGAMGIEQYRTVNPIDGKERPSNFTIYDLPVDQDYIFSSHCLEHISDWVKAVNYWHQCLIHGGVLFLYLPHPDQVYWRPWNNRKHINSLSPELLRGYFENKTEGNGTSRHSKWTNIFVTDGYDLNHSFYAIAEKV